MIKLFNVNKKVAYLIIPSWSICFVTSQTYASIPSTFQNCLLQSPILEISSADSEIFLSMTFLGKGKSCREPNLDETGTDRTNWWNIFFLKPTEDMMNEQLKYSKWLDTSWFSIASSDILPFLNFLWLQTSTHSRFLSYLILTVPQEHDFLSRDFWTTLKFQ